MRILIVAWEYPPRALTSIAPHIADVASDLVAAGHDVSLLTRHGAVTKPGIDLIDVVDHPPRVPSVEPFAYVQQQNLAMVAAGAKVMRVERFDVIHAVGWQVGYVAATLHTSFRVPLVVSVGSTEFGRCGGRVESGRSRLVRQVEWWMTYLARRVITYSGDCASELESVFELPADKIDTIGMTEHCRSRRILFSGGVVYKNDAHTFVKSIPAIRLAIPDAEFVIVGAGDTRAGLERQVRDMGVSRVVEFRDYFAGDPDARTIADIVVVPSLSEPYGVVALEAIACGVPLVVGATEEMKRLADSDPRCVSVEPERPHELAQAVFSLLRNRATVRAPGSAYSAVYRRAISAEREFASDERPMRLVSVSWCQG